MDFRIDNPNEGSAITLNEHPYEGHPGITLVDIDITFPSEVVPQTVDIRFDFPCIDIYSSAFLGSQYDKTIGVTWSMRKTDFRLASGLPMHQLVSSSGMNRMTLSVSDAMTPARLSTGIQEATARIVASLQIFTNPVTARSAYHTVLYLDTRDVRYDEARKDVERYWDTVCGYHSAYTPDTARRPLYSTWYSFHHELSVDEVVKQCDLAREYGMESVIVDDGWQFDQPAQGYNRCGDWEPAKGKVPDMKEFVDRVHALGMKFTLWYSVPFMGTAAKNYERFKTMLLNPSHSKSPCLDPRFPEVRRFLTETYVKAVKDWGLDGFKLDFIDSFSLSDETPAFDERWDTISLEEGVDRLLRDVTDGLRAINPDILIEFRQRYYGPAVRKYGNMIRVGDCPNDSLANHVAGLDLRFALGRSAVHSDMLMWHPDTPVEAAAYQVITTLFLVPQISVLLDKIPQSHRDMLKFYLKFWNEHRATLLDGELNADNPESLYSQVRSVRDGEMIAVSYAKPVLSVHGDLRLYHVNATDSERLYVRFETDGGDRRLVIRDCTGAVTEDRAFRASEGVHEFLVPRSGMMEVI